MIFLFPTYDPPNWALQGLDSFDQQSILVQNIQIPLLIASNKGELFIPEAKKTGEVGHRDVYLSDDRVFSIVSYLNKSFFKETPDVLGLADEFKVGVFSAIS